jgi:hypothetical protein
MRIVALGQKPGPQAPADAKIKWCMDAVEKIANASHIPEPVSTAVADLAAHLADTSDAHDASAISYAGGTGISATNVEAAIDELATEKLNTADLLAAILAVDGSGSGINADLLDGQSSAAFALSARNLTAGSGLTGGGDLSADRTFNVGAGTGISVAADTVGLDTAHSRNTDHAVTLIASGSLPAAAALDITNIPQTFSYLALSVTGMSFNADAALRIQVSIDNGANFDTTAANYSANTPSIAAGQTIPAANVEDNSILIFGYRAGTVPLAIRSNRRAGLAGSPSEGSYWGSTAGVNALRLTSASANFDAGTYALYGVV